MALIEISRITEPGATRTVPLTEESAIVDCLVSTCIFWLSGLYQIGYLSLPRCDLFDVALGLGAEPSVFRSGWLKVLIDQSPPSTG